MGPLPVSHGMPPTSGSKTTKQKKESTKKKTKIRGIRGKVGNQPRNLRGGGGLGDKRDLEYD